MSSKLCFTADASQFPTDCTNHILSYLDLQSLGRFCRISKKCNVVGSVEKLLMDKLPKELVSIVPNGEKIKKFFSQKAVRSNQEILERIDSFLKKIKTNGIFRCHFPLVGKESRLIIKIGRQGIDPRQYTISDPKQFEGQKFFLEEEYIFIKKANTTTDSRSGLCSRYSWAYISAIGSPLAPDFNREGLSSTESRVQSGLYRLDAAVKMQKIVTIIGLIGLTLGVGLASKQS